jgi:hypothetical protein
VTIDVTDGNFAGMGTPLGSATVTWDFDGDVLTSNTTDNTIATGNNATYGFGVDSQDFSSGNPNDAISGNNWLSTSAADALTNGDFFQFTINAPAGVELTINSVEFDDDASGTGPGEWGVYIGSSLEGTGTTSQSFSVNPMNTVNTSTTIPCWRKRNDKNCGICWRYESKWNMAN